MFMSICKGFFDFLIGFRWIDEDCQLRFSGLTWILARLKWDFNQQELVFFSHESNRKCTFQWSIRCQPPRPPFNDSRPTARSNTPGVGGGVSGRDLDLEAPKIGGE